MKVSVKPGSDESVSRRHLRRLFLEWDEKTEGSIEGAGDLIRGIAYTKGYKAVDHWHWTEDSLTA